MLLGGLYDLTKAPQSKNGSATDVMPPAKKAIHSQDFKRTCQRYQLPIKMHEQHPLRSVDAGRLLCSVTDEQRGFCVPLRSATEKADPRHSGSGPVLAKAIYHAYFFTNENINERPVLLRIAKTALPGVSVDESVRSPTTLYPMRRDMSDENLLYRLLRSSLTCNGSSSCGPTHKKVTSQSRDCSTDAR